MPLKPLEGIRVLELGHIVSAPFATLLLSDLGAEIVKVERIQGGDPFRETPYFGESWFLYLNANKKSLAVDMKTPKGVEIIRKLAEQSDIVVENFAPGVVERLGISYETLSKDNPRLIYCSIKGFGEGEYANRPALDQVIQAMSGLMSVTGEPGRPPVRVGTSIIDMGAGTYCAAAAILALYNREKTGKGQKILVPLFDVAVSWMGQWLAYYDLYQKLPEPMGGGYPNWSPYEMFRTADGKWVFIGVTDDNAWLRFCNALGLEKLAKNEQFSTSKKRVQNKQDLTSVIKPIIETMKADDIIQSLVQEDVPCAHVNTIDKVVNDPYLNKGKLATIDWNKDKTVRIPLLPIQSDVWNVSGRSKPPELGEDTIEIMKRLGYKNSDIDELVEAKTVGTQVAQDLEHPSSRASK